VSYVTLYAFVAAAGAKGREEEEEDMS